MAKFQPYDSYKACDVPWLGDVPSGWGATRLKFECRVNMGQSPSSDDCNAEGFGLPFLQGNAEFTRTTPNAKQYCDVAKKVAEKGDLLLSVRAPVGALNRADQAYGIGRGLCAITPSRNVVKEFLWWLVPVVRTELESISTGSTFESVAAEQVENVRFYAPSLMEQRQIAAFLDHETANIDRLIAKQERLIALLKEKRQAVISHAVTKGLNPDAPMKDSGVEWLGEVPAHWAIHKTKRLFHLVAEPAPANNDYELLSIYTDIGVRPRKELEQKGNKASTTDGYWIVKRGDIIVNKLLAWMGATGYSDYEGVTSPAYDILRKAKKLNPRFYHFLWRTKMAQTEFKRWSRGIMEMRLRLYFDELGRIDMPYPPEPEQDAIVTELERIESKFEKIIEKSQSSISLLQEHRTALISAAVTGKIDVRNFKPANA